MLANLAAPLEMAVSFEPSDGLAGGDLVDAIMLADDREMITICDACGHGLDATLSAAAVWATLHSLAPTGLSPRAILEQLDRQLADIIVGSRFVTALALRVEPDGRLTALNAGHPPILHYRAETGDIRRVAAASHGPLGLKVGTFRPETIEIGPADRLLLYTDGLTEQRDRTGGMVGVKGLAEMFSGLCAKADRPPTEIRDQLRDALRGPEFGGRKEDDQTFVVLGAPVAGHGLTG
ncbi:MAG: PP2C family protein-serine/threonine phosphatase [Phycisphaeraceae bacterium]|nr:PP2C family protein-serine/threonine phosphatase [Phycisphaeraceae bacterium]